MSVLRKGDEDLHYSDNSHRWIAPPSIDQNAWNAGMRAHLSLHLTTMGGPVEVDELRECRPPRIPRQSTVEQVAQHALVQPAAQPVPPVVPVREVSRRAA